MKLFSSMTISEKREKLMELVELRSNTARRKRKRKSEELLHHGKEESHPNRIIKRKKMFAHVYKKMFRNARKKVKALNQVTDVIVKETCSGSKYKKERVFIDLEGAPLISSADGAVHETDVQRGSCTKNKIKLGSVELSEFQFEVSSEIRNNVLPYVNKLRDYWHRGHNAVIFDGKERLRKVVFFVLSLLDNTSRPILIVVASSVLSLWETEFSKWSNLVNVVTYKGSKDDRAAIRESRFYDEKGSITFQVLLSCPDVIVEDFKAINDIKWDSLVLDECQRQKRSLHYQKINMIVADMKLLMVTEEVDIENVRHRYGYILSLLDIQTDADMETNDDDTRTLKESLSPFIAFECKFSTTEIKEYWVPVHLSSTQVEQYCSILDSNLEALSSGTKNISLVHGILTRIRKCCDHPYLVDPTLRNSSEKDASVDSLGVDIEVSGKLQVLDKLLHEIKRTGLRAIVLFRPGESLGNVSIGDILDDYIHQRFGQDSYVHIPLKVPNELARRNKKEALKMFNCVDNGKFICLVEFQACYSSIPFSHVDVAILFNSHWNPYADIKALLKISDDSNHEQLKVLRLYSAFTVEEKVLLFAKQGAPLHIRMRYINWTTCQKLLSWGASYLFKHPTFESSVFDDLFRELSSLLTNTRGKMGSTNCSIISNAELHDGSYSRSSLLLGETESHTKESSSIDEYLIENNFSVFWTNLLKESHHQRKNKSFNKSSRKVQKSSRNSRYMFESIRRKARSKRKAHKRSGQSPWAGLCLHAGGRQSSETSPTSDQGESIRESPSFSPPEAQLPNAPPTSISDPLEAESERIQKEQEQDDKLHQEKKSMLLAECEKEISEVRKKYDALINESETCLTKERKIREDYQALVDANKLLAMILARELNLNTTENETSSFKVHQIPASALIQPTNPCSTSVLITHISRQSLGRSAIRAPAPHLRLNPLLFPSFLNRPTTLDPFLNPLPTQLTPQTLPHTQAEWKNVI